MAKKSIHNLPEADENSKKINYKNIGIGIGAIIIVVALSFLSFGDNKKEEQKKKEVNRSQRIDESENISTTEEIKKIVEANPVLQAAAPSNNLELEKLKLEKEYELKILQEQYRQERLAWEQERKRAALNLIQGGGDHEKPKEKEAINPYAGIEIPPFPDYPKEDPNLQEYKKQYAMNSMVDEFILKKQLQPAISKYEVKAGTIIPLTLETAINSDLPGKITAVVKTDVYDSATGTILLIPAGSRVIGQYSSDVSFGQERVQAVINRITLPNQKSINIGSMNLVDKLGASGVSDKVDTKLGKVFTSVIMSAILGVGAGAVKEDNNESDSWKNDAINSGGTQAINVGNNYANKVLNVQPSLKIRNGFTVGLFVDKDLILEAYK